MKEHPILFSGDMVKAILDGRKTQTRRVVKPQPKDVVSAFWTPVGKWEHPDQLFLWFSQEGHCHATAKCPYGKPGDRLWVRETFCIGAIVGGDSLPEELNDPWYISQCKDETDVIYKADIDGTDIGTDDMAWKPSIFMPRWASRILLEVTAVRVKRVQDITGEDVEAEGVEFPDGKSALVEHIRDRWEPFRRLWDSINDKRGFGWDVNPWVWVVTFKRIEA